jgi:predicted RNase H-like HicB family nuclease
MPNYRVLVTYDPERSVFLARAPELEHCSAEGATRTEALVKLEEEIEAQLRNVREQGGRPPSAVDEDGELSGAIAVTVSRTLHRDLVWQARNEGIELGALVGEMLAAGLEVRRQRGRRPAMNAQPEPRAPTGPTGNDAEQPPRRDDRRSFNREGAGRGQGGRYHAIMEDRATFLEYVRGLESGGGRGPGSFNPGGGGGRGPDPRRPRGPTRPGGGRGGTGGPGGGGSSDEGGA